MERKIASQRGSRDMMHELAFITMWSRRAHAPRRLPRFALVPDAIGATSPEIPDARPAEAA